MWLLLSAIIVGSVCLLAYLLRPDPRMKEMGDKLPGPPTLPIIGNLKDIPTSGEEGLKMRMEDIKKYGHVCRYWLGNILATLISDPKDAEVLFNSMRTINKNRMYDNFYPWLGTGLLTSSGEKWHLRRKIITPAFHFKILEQFIDVFNKNSKILTDTLEQEMTSPGFDLEPYISRYTLDVICETAMGVEVNAQKDSTSRYVAAVRDICRVIFIKIYRPWLRNGFLSFLSGFQRIQTEALKVLHGFTNQVIKEKKEYFNRHPELLSNGDSDLGIKCKTAFLELLIKSSMKPDNKTFFCDDDIREEVDTFMFEGHDTTKAAICSTLQLLAKHQDVQERVVEELQSVLGTQDTDVTFQHLQEFKYLECVIKESLRLYPSVPIIGRSITEDVALPSGHVIPAGAEVGISIYFIHRNEEHWPNPEKFDPDNFLPDRIAKRHPFAYVPFSAGPRNCIGQKFAMLELKASLAKILCKYKLEYAGKQWDIIPNPNLVFQSTNGYHIRISKRSKWT